MCQAAAQQVSCSKCTWMFVMSQLLVLHQLPTCRLILLIARVPMHLQPLQLDK